MAIKFLTKVRERKILPWAYIGLLIFVSAFLWAPSRDGLQGVYVLAFFLPMLPVLFSRRPSFLQYGGWMTLPALLYAGFAALSSLWGEPQDIGFFILQWLVLAVWLCGSCFVFTQYDVNISKYLDWFVILGAFITITVIIRYYYFVYGFSTFDKRLWGWNVFRNPNEIGAMCGIISLLAVTIALQSLTLRRTWFFYFIALLAFVGLVLSFSRGALLALILTAPITLIIIRPALKIWLPPVLIIAAVILSALILTDLENYYTGGRGDVFGGRFDIWKVVFDDFRENMLLGIGMSKDTGIDLPGVAVFNHAHNAWIDSLYRTGLIGIIFILWHLKEVLQKFSRNNQLLPLYLWLVYGCICSLIDGRCFFWEIGAKWFLYWIPAGLIAAVYTGMKVRNMHADAKNL